MTGQATNQISSAESKISLSTISKSDSNASRLFYIDNVRIFLTGV
jgi:hypothetical protein